MLTLSKSYAVKTRRPLGGLSWGTLGDQPELPGCPSMQHGCCGKFVLAPPPAGDGRPTGCANVPATHWCPHNSARNGAVSGCTKAWNTGIPKNGKAGNPGVTYKFSANSAELTEMQGNNSGQRQMVQATPPLPVHKQFPTVCQTKTSFHTNLLLPGHGPLYVCSVNKRRQSTLQIVFS
jgi:hypothetical protein